MDQQGQQQPVNLDQLLQQAGGKALEELLREVQANPEAFLPDDQKRDNLGRFASEP